ncbi:hypothetical protein QN277_011633 [Acacia crassicarpa]|uniref:Uncharacterized protein n=1 Tax=Acacia crassicarpa TaxID=499986 RepID=A0AAE1MYW6_9FABA|nr:hypothetical protein QN277_011633 [Acacia crassicarpa]
MRPIVSPSGQAMSVWKSPVPYLFGGLGLVLVLMSLALIIIFCSNIKRPSSPSSSSSSSSPDEEEGGFRLQVMAMADSEPKILVIMPGRENPTYLANPIVPLSYCTCQPQPPNPSSSSSSTCVPNNNSDLKINN